MRNVVAYGTLLFPEVAYPVAQIDQTGEPALVRGYRRYEVNTKIWGGNFPAVVPDPECCFEGLLFRDLTEKQIAQLDLFENVEGGDYKRVTTTAEVAGEEVEAWIYVMDKAMEKRMHGPLTNVWSPELFLRLGMPMYLARVVYPFVDGDTYKERFGLDD